MTVPCGFNRKGHDVPDPCDETCRNIKHVKILYKYYEDFLVLFLRNVRPAQLS